MTYAVDITAHVITPTGCRPLGSGAPQRFCPPSGSQAPKASDLSMSCFAGYLFLVWFKKRLREIKHFSFRDTPNCCDKPHLNDPLHMIHPDSGHLNDFLHVPPSAEDMSRQLTSCWKANPTSPCTPYHVPSQKASNSSPVSPALWFQLLLLVLHLFASDQPRQPANRIRPSLRCSRGGREGPLRGDRALKHGKPRLNGIENRKRK